MEINWWQDKGRHDVGKYPYIVLPDFGETVRHWWQCLQPEWRGSSMSRDPPANHSWVQYKVGGPNGLFLVVMCLSWWVQRLTEDRADFTAVVDDFTWVLTQFDKVIPSAATTSRRGGRVSQPSNQVIKISKTTAPVAKPKAKGSKRPASEKAASVTTKKQRRR